MSERILKVLANCDQGLSDGQKLQARINIASLHGVKVTVNGSTTSLVPDENQDVTVDLDSVSRVQSNWDETNPVEPSFILNKPDIPAPYAWTHVGTVDSDAGVTPAMRIVLAAQSSGAVLVSKMLRNSITLEAGKKYLFLPKRFCGNAFYTKTVDESRTKNWQLRVVLADADLYTYSKHPTVACGEFSVFNFVADGNQDVPATGEKMSAGLSPETVVYAPAEDITLDRFLLVPNGNIIGCGIPEAQNSVLYVNCAMVDGFEVYEI